MAMVRRKYKLIPSRDIDDQRILESDWPDVHNWPEPTESDSLRCYLPLMTNSIQKTKISNDSFQRN